MIVVMKPESSKSDIDAVLDRAKGMGCEPKVMNGIGRTLIDMGDDVVHAYLLETIPSVERVVKSTHPYKLASKEVKPTRTVIKVSEDVAIGGREITVIAGPCAVEGREEFLETARIVKENGGHILRGGAFKPRTSPYSFQGLGEEGLKYMAMAREELGMPFITEVMEPENVCMIADYADILQVGARNVQNFTLLKKLGSVNKPVLLKRGMMTTLEETLMSAEYIMSAGNSQVILCERGIRTFETATRNTMDVSAVPVFKELSHLPVILDPSHAAGKWNYVGPLSYAAIAAGADGLMIEVHPNPEKAFSDGPQSLKPDKFAEVMGQLKEFARVSGRVLN